MSQYRYGRPDDFEPQSVQHRESPGGRHLKLLDLEPHELLVDSVNSYCHLELDRFRLTHVVLVIGQGSCPEPNVRIESDRK